MESLLVVGAHTKQDVLSGRASNPAMPLPDEDEAEEALDELEDELLDDAADELLAPP